MSLSKCILKIWLIIRVLAAEDYIEIYLDFRVTRLRFRGVFLSVDVDIVMKNIRGHPFKTVYLNFFFVKFPYPPIFISRRTCFHF